MKKIFILFFLLPFIAAAQSLTDTHIIGQSAKTYRFGKSLDVMDTLAVEDVLWLPTGAGSGKVLTSSSTGIASWQTATSSGWLLTGNTPAATGADFLGTTSSSSIWFRTNNLQRMRLDSAGRLSIGTITAVSLFEVANLVQFNPNNFSTRLGEGAGANNSGNYNTAVGWHAVGGSGAGTSGERNTGDGFDCLGRITSGIWNTAKGVGAMQFSTIADYCVAIGASALGANTTGDDNTAVGSESMFANTTGYQNDAYGRHSMLANISGSYNSSIGGGSMAGATSADSNTVVGVDGGRAITVGGSNVAIGMNSGPALIVPFDNLSGSFTVGEQVNEAGGGYGFIKKIVGSTLFVGGGSGLYWGWADNDVLTGASSGATALINGTPDNPDHTIAMGSGLAGGIGLAALTLESGAVNIGNLYQGKQDVTGDSTLNLIRLTGTTTITEVLAFSRKDINTTAGDGSTQNAPTGRFRKDTSGATFTLTNAYITANSTIFLTPANAAIDATALYWTVSAGAGSATITFNAAPTANFDMGFLVLN